MEQLDRRILAESLHDEGWSEAQIEGQNLNSTLHRGWYWGSESFREWLLDKLEGKPEPASRDNRSGPLRSDHAKATAERILNRGREEPGFATRKEMATRRRGDWRQVAIAWAIWRNTTGISQKWISDQLGLKSAADASQLIRRFEQTPQKLYPEPVRR